MRAITDNTLRDYFEAHAWSADTQRTYTCVLSQFLSDVRPGGPDWEKRATGWPKKLGAKVGQRTISHYVVWARTFLDWLVARGSLKNNPLKHVSIKTYDFSTKPVLQPEEAVTLLDWSAEQTGVLGTRIHAALSLMLFTGLRLGGVVSINLEDIAKSGKRWTAHYTAKGHGRGKDAFVVLQTRVVDAIRDYVGATGREMKGEGALFLTQRGKRMERSTMRHAIVAAFERAGVAKPGLTPHSLRHTCAVMAYKAGAGVMEIMGMLGHRSLNTTQRYLQSLSRIDTAAEMTVDYSQGARKAEK
ncbi:MAG: tyrosine-type recombinase/integrase [Gemmatimonadota bacterium]